MSTPRYRPVRLGHAPVTISTGSDGIVRACSTEPLGPYPERLLDRLVEGAERFPDRTFVARRGADGEWQRITYAMMVARARAIAQALLDRRLSGGRPVMILTENSLEHLQLAFGAMWAGVPHSPLSPAASLLSQDFAKIHHAVNLLTPGLVLAGDGAAFGAAIHATVPESVEVVLTGDAIEGRACTQFDALIATAPTAAVDAAYAATGAGTIVKLLFTSGSTRVPKAVVTTNRMLCSNQQMLLQTFPVLGEEPPVMLDWLPWNHTFGGSHNVGIALYNGGTLYIDDGKPTPQQFGETLRNLREIATTLYFNVPRGWEELGEALETDAALRETFYSKLKLQFFAAAGLSQAAWDRLDRIAERHCGERIRMMTGLGMTETSPSSMFTTVPEVKSGYVGLPCPGCEMKLVPMDGKLEVRFRGPHVMPGYWRMHKETAAVFDEESYYCSGDALRFVDPARPEYGFAFDGRIAEDFKLSSGSFVSVGPLRARVIAEGAPYVQDVVVTGVDCDDIGILVFPRLDNCRALAGAGADAPAPAVLAAVPVRTWFQDLVDRMYRAGTGSASRVARGRLLTEPPSIEAAEITDKGSINQRAVLKHREALVASLHDGSDPGLVLPRRGAG